MSEQIEKFFKDFFPNIKFNEDCIEVNNKNKGETYKIPSDLFPVSAKGEIGLHTFTNTMTVAESQEISNIEKRKITTSFNEIEFLTGRCYTNTSNLSDKLKKSGLNPNDIETYVGWLIIDDVPIHHSWLVYKDIHLFDGGVMASAEIILREKLSEKNVKDKEDLRLMYADIIKEEQKKKNSDTRIFGKVLPNHMYIGRPCNPEVGREEFRNLIKNYPNHPSYQEEGMNAKGASKLQNKLLSD